MQVATTTQFSNLNLRILIFSPRIFRLSFVLFFLCWRALGADYQWEDGSGYRRAKLQPTGAGKNGFTLLPGEQTGVRFTNYLSEQRALASQILPSGSGVAAGDVDGDGWCDLYFCALKSGNH